MNKIHNSIKIVLVQTPQAFCFHGVFFSHSQLDGGFSLVSSVARIVPSPFFSMVLCCCRSLFVCIVLADFLCGLCGLGAARSQVNESKGTSRAL